MHKKIVVIGGVAAGATAAAKARRTDEFAEITLIEKGPYISYANCGLPYYLGGDIKNKRDVLLHTPKSFGDRFNTEVYIKTEATSIDRKNKTVKARKGNKELTFEYDKLIMAVGSKPIIPPIEGLKDINYFLMRTVEDADKAIKYIKNKKPESAIIIGGGYIGIEVADAMRNCKISTTIIEALDSILPNYPGIISFAIKKEIESLGINIKVRSKVKKVRQKDSKVIVSLEGGNNIETDMLFVCAGIKPDIDLAIKAGLAIDELGAIVVDKFMKTTDVNIYAAGDAVSKVNRITGKKVLLQLAGPANREGRVAGCNAAGGNMSFPGVIGTSIVGFDALAGGIAVAGTGITYEEALKEGFDADFTYTCDPQHVSYYPNPKYIFLQMVFDKSNGRVLGAFASGFEDVARKIDVIATAIYNNMTIDDLSYVDYCYSPAYGSAKDNVNIASYVANNIKHKEYNSVSPENFLKLYTQNDELQILDVRSTPEVKAEKIDGATNIYINELRNNLSLLDKDKDIYVYCEVGFRGYISAKLLKQHGFKAYNIRGGIDAVKRIYEACNIKNMITTNN